MTHDCSFVADGATLADGLALYLHIPYCTSRCSYCDFNAHVLPQGQSDPFAPYAQALVADILDQEAALVSTIFWGGGTPSLMPVEALQTIVSALREKFDFHPDLENSIEMNPGTEVSKKYERYLELGINRLSIGAQSFHQEHLELVGRIHSGADIERAVREGRCAGFENISLDLIYGFPQQTVSQWKETLSRALALEPNHLSVYQLTVEPSTRLQTQLAAGDLVLPPEDDMIEMDDWAVECLLAEGYRRYEVSNWAKPGWECRHNLRYWSDKPYLGLGCGGVSYVNGWRFERIKAPVYYQRAMEVGRSPIVFAERRDRDGILKDHLMMGLRVDGGVDADQLCARYQGLTTEHLDSFFQRLPRAWWCRDGDRFSLTRKGWDFHSDVTIELMNVMFSFS